MIPKSILTCADIEWREGLPFSRQFNDIYYSRQDGLEETYYTFIEGNNLPDRWQQASKNSFAPTENTRAVAKSQTPFQIVEFGFGTGLNFFATAQCWQQLRSSDSKVKDRWLHFHSIEKYPLTKTDFEKSAALWPSITKFSEPVIEAYPLPFQGVYRIDIAEIKVSLFLYWMELIEGLTEIATSQSASIDAFYLDGFAPAKNPDAWAQVLFNQIELLASDNATLATFSAAGFVRRGLRDCGFLMSKRDGFGSKREMLIGKRSSPADQDEFNKSSSSIYAPPTVQKTNRVAIIGAGIAGCTTARELAEAGLEVTIFDKSTNVASGASGSSAGIFYPFLSNDINATSQFYLQGYYSLLQSLQTFSLNSYVFPIGVTLKNTGDKLRQNIIHWLNKQPELSRWIKLTEQGNIFFPLSGYVDVKALCSHLVDHELIKTQFQSTLTQLNRIESRWQLCFEDMSELFDTVVLCNSFDVGTLLPEQFYPANKVRGQTAIINGLETPALDSVWCDSVYAIPLSPGKVYGGATFELNNERSEFSADSHRQLIKELNELLLTELDQSQCELGRIGFRYCSIDRLPYVGPVSNHSVDKHSYRDLHLGKRISNYEPPEYQPNLFINIAHGARGITSSFLSAKIVRSYIQNESFPVPFHLVEKSHPNRQLIKELKKRPEKRVEFFKT